MTREEIIKEAIDYVQMGRFSYYHEVYDEMFAVLKCFADTNAKYVNYKDTRWYLDEKKSIMNVYLISGSQNQRHGTKSHSLVEVYYE